MAGFFKKTDFYDRNRGKRYSCLTCGLSKNCISPKMKPAGSRKVSILHVGEAPGQVEDEKGEQFIGKSGKYYERISRQVGISIHDGLKINSVNCRPEGNETPTDDQITACRSSVFKTVKEYKPHVIFLIGSIALQSYLGNRIHKGLGGIFKWRGWTIPDHDYGAWICPIFHPSFVLRKKKKNPAAETIFRQDIERGQRMLNVSLPDPIPLDNVKVLVSNYEKHSSGITIAHADHSKIERYLKRILDKEPEYLAFDYETTGLRPIMEGHRIQCVGLSWSRTSAIAFPCFDWSKQNRRLFRKIMAHERIKKIAHNIKMEDRWTFHMFGEDVIRNWHFDSMNGSHVDDNRTGVTSLKFQAMVRYGIWDYSSEIESYLKGHGNKGANNFNRIKKAPQKELMTYCGGDAMITYNLALDQMMEMGIW